jgi:hypothetical protein
MIDFPAERIETPEACTPHDKRTKHPSFCTHSPD